MNISVVVVGQLGPFYGYHIYIDEVWAARLTAEREVVEEMARRLELNTRGALGAVSLVAQWLLANYPHCQHPGGMEFDLELMSERPNTASAGEVGRYV